MNKLKTVLLIDDSDDDNFYHQEILTESKMVGNIWEFLYAEEALEFLKQPESRDVDLIFLDINMPRMDGFEFLDYFEKTFKEKIGDTKIIMLTTSSFPDDREKALHYKSVADFKNKPLNEQAFREIMEQHFNLGSN